MSRSKQYITSLLDNVPITELSDFEHRTTFDQIKERISSADDVVTELKTLFRVNNFSDFALGLLWIADKVERDPSMLESTPEEQTLILSAFRKAVGDTGESFGPAPTAAPPEPMVEMPSGFGPEPEPMVEAPAGFGPEPMADFPSATTPEPEPIMAEPPPSAPPVVPAAGEGPAETQFAQLVEKFVVAVQNGSEDRDAIKEQVLSTCAAILAEGSGATDDYRNFCQVLTAFINYISENQFMDDIRVMNLLSNVTDPVWQWARADEASRAGMMDGAYDVLRDYKSLFE